MSLQISLCDSYNTSPFLDVTPRITGNSEFVTGEHGFGQLTVTILMGLWESFQLMDRPGLPYVSVREFGVIVWEGRLEDVKLVAGGVTLTAFGYWRALTDQPYTALWSYSRVGDFRLCKTSDDAGFSPNLYQTDLLDRLFVTAQKNATLGFTGTSKFGGLLYDLPNRRSHQIIAVSFNYNVTNPAANFVGKLFTYTLDQTTLAPTFVATAWTQAGTGSGSQTLALTACDRLVFALGRNAADAAYAGESGSDYLSITGLRILTTASASLYADEIARDLVATIHAANPNQLSATTLLIRSPGVDLTVAPYQDKYPADILDTLAHLGDSESPPALYETGVWEGQLLSFQKRGTTARTWCVDITALELERTIATLYNSVYATYTDALGYVLRTPTNTDSNSIARYGVTRTQMVQTQTTTAAQANTQRDAALQDGKDPQPRITLAFGELYDAAGSRYPLWMARAWDTLIMRNLPMGISAAIDRIRSFRVTETRYDPVADMLTVTPEQFLPSLDVLTARATAGVRVNA